MLGQEGREGRVGAGAGGRGQGDSPGVAGHSRLASPHVTPPALRPRAASSRPGLLTPRPPAPQLRSVLLPVEWGLGQMQSLGLGLPGGQRAAGPRPAPPQMGPRRVGASVPVRPHQVQKENKARGR